MIGRDGRAQSDRQTSEVNWISYKNAGWNGWIGGTTNGQITYVIEGIIIDEIVKQVIREDQLF